MGQRRGGPSATYIRLRPGGSCLSWQARDGSHVDRELLFIDVDEGSDLLALRRLPHEVLRGCTIWLLRTAGPLTPAQVGVLDRLVGELRFGVEVIARIEHPLGVAPIITTIAVPTLAVPVDWSPPAGLWQLAREVELRALMAWGMAIWEPGDHHFVLPGGMHINAFINIGNAIRCRRDAIVVASWLMRRASAQTVLVIDTRTLLVVGFALDRLIADASPGARLRTIELVEDFPRNTIDIMSKLDRAQQQWDTARDLSDTRLVAVITVNLSGRLRDHLLQALQAMEGAVDVWSIDVLVDQGAPISARTTPALQRIDAWSQRVVEQHVTPEDCALCRDRERATQVLIEPGTFQVRFRSQLDIQMPDLTSPRANHRLFEMLYETDAVEVVASPGGAMYRANRPMTVKVRFDRLLDPEKRPADLVPTVAQAIGDWASSRAGRRIVLVSEAEATRPHFDAFWQSIEGELDAPPERVTYALDDWDEQTREAIEQADHLLVFGLSSITGHSMYRALEGAQALRRDRSYDIHGLVVHSRPATARVWSTLYNAFARHLKYIWQTYMPEAPCPFRAEKDIYDGLELADLTPAQEDLLEQRRQVCSGSGDGSALFLGSAVDRRISAHSLYGDRLGERAIYAAVGAAVHARRCTKQTQGPKRLVFEMCAIARSYYDPLIFASMLRWIASGEAWWGEQPDRDATMALRELLARAKPLDHDVVLLSELLLACTLSKIPAGEPREVIRTAAEPYKASQPAVGLMLAALRASGMSSR